MDAPNRKLTNAFFFTVIALFLCAHPARAEEATTEINTSFLQLEVFINDVTTGMVGEFRQAEDGTLMVRAKELREVGLRPSKEALGADGWIVLARLPKVSHQYDEAAQILYFKTTDEYRQPRQLNARNESNNDEESAQETEQAKSSFGAYANYRIYTSFTNENLLSTPELQGISELLIQCLFLPMEISTIALSLNPI